MQLKNLTIKKWPLCFVMSCVPVFLWWKSLIFIVLPTNLFQWLITYSAKWYNSIAPIAFEQNKILANTTYLKSAFWIEIAIQGSTTLSTLGLRSLCFTTVRQTAIYSFIYPHRLLCGWESVPACVVVPVSINCGPNNWNNSRMIIEIND